MSWLCCAGCASLHDQIARGHTRAACARMRDDARARRDGDAATPMSPEDAVALARQLAAATRGTVSFHLLTDEEARAAGVAVAGEVVRVTVELEPGSLAPAIEANLDSASRGWKQQWFDGVYLGDALGECGTGQVRTDWLALLGFLIRAPFRLMHVIAMAPARLVETVAATTAAPLEILRGRPLSLLRPRVRLSSEVFRAPVLEPEPPPPPPEACLRGRAEAARLRALMNPVAFADRAGLSAAQRLGEDRERRRAVVYVAIARTSGAGGEASLALHFDDTCRGAMPVAVALPLGRGASAREALDGLVVRLPAASGPDEAAIAEAQRRRNFDACMTSRDDDGWLALSTAADKLHEAGERLARCHEVTGAWGICSAELQQRSLLEWEDWEPSAIARIDALASLPAEVAARCGPAPALPRDPFARDGSCKAGGSYDRCRQNLAQTEQTFVAAKKSWPCYEPTLSQQAQRAREASCRARHLEPARR